MKGIWIRWQAIHFAIFPRFIQRMRFINSKAAWNSRTLSSSKRWRMYPLCSPATKSSRIAASLHWAAVTAAKLPSALRIFKRWKNYIENHSQRQRYKRHFADVSVTPATIISAFAIELQWSWCKLLWLVRRKALWKMKSTKGCFGSEWREAYLVTWLCWMRADGDGAWRHGRGLNHEALLQVTDWQALLNRCNQGYHLSRTKN